MKKVYLVFLLSVIYLNLSAQFKLGMEAGLNIADLKAADYSRNGAVVGITGEYAFQGKWLLQSGFLFSMKGANAVKNYSNLQKDSEKLDIALYYLELPIMVGYHIPLANEISLVPKVGGYLAVGVGGQVSQTTDVGPGFLINEWNPFKDSTNGAFDRKDAGLRFGLTTHIYKFNISIYYDLGLYGINSMLNVPNKIHNRSGCITLGYTLL